MHRVQLKMILKVHVKVQVVCVCEPHLPQSRCLDEASATWQGEKGPVMDEMCSLQTDFDAWVGVSLLARVAQ